MSCNSEDETAANACIMISSSYDIISASWICYFPKLVIDIAMLPSMLLYWCITGSKQLLIPSDAITCMISTTTNITNCNFELDFSPSISTVINVLPDHCMTVLQWTFIHISSHNAFIGTCFKDICRNHFWFANLVDDIAMETCSHQWLDSLLPCYYQPTPLMSEILYI